MTTLAIPYVTSNQSIVKRERLIKHANGDSPRSL